MGKAIFATGSLAKKAILASCLAVMSIHPSHFPDGQTLTLEQAHERYQFLAASLERDNITPLEERELAIVSALFLRAQEEILAVEPVAVNLRRSYHIAFVPQQENQEEDLKALLHWCLALDSQTMVSSFKKEEWYRSRILPHLDPYWKSDLDMVTAAHESQMQAISSIQCAVCLQEDAFTEDLSSRLTSLYEVLTRFSRLQVEFHAEWREKVDTLLGQYKSMVLQEDPSITPELLLQREDAMIREASERAREILSSDLVQIIDDTFQRVGRQAETLSPDYKAFILYQGRFLASLPPQSPVCATTNRRYYDLALSYIEHVLIPYGLTREVQTHAANPAIWSLHRVDRYVLNQTSYSLALILNSIQQVASMWRIKLETFHMQMGRSPSLRRSTQIQHLVDTVFHLQALAIQHALHQEKLTFYTTRAQELITQQNQRERQPSSQTLGMERILIQHSVSKLYLAHPQDSPLATLSEDPGSPFTIWNLIQYDGKLKIRSPDPSPRYLSLQPSSFKKIQYNTPRQESVTTTPNFYEATSWKLLKMEELLATALCYVRPLQDGGINGVNLRGGAPYIDNNCN